MPKVIRAVDRGHPAPFNFDDVAAQAAACVAQARAEASAILAQATQDATTIREHAEIEGRRAAEATIDRIIEERVGARLCALTPALEKSFADFQRARQDWLARWETGVVRLATAMARRVVRRELSAQPEIPLALVREALHLTAGSGRARLLMNPADVQSLGSQVRSLLSEIAPVATTELVGDPSISQGGCRIETEHGSVDQQFETQLARIAEELI